VVERLNVALTNGIENFDCFFKRGVIWNAMRNNFTIDGRFLDLETPILLGAPFIGIAEYRFRNFKFHSIVGLDTLSFLFHFRRFICFVVNRVDFLLEQGALLAQREVILGQEFLSQLRSIFDKNHILFSEKKACRHVFNRAISEMEVPSQNHAALLEFIKFKYKNPKPKISSAPWFPLEEVPFSWPSDSAFSNTRLYSLKFLNSKRSAFSEGEFLNKEIVDKILKVTDLDQLIEAMMGAQKKIMNYCRALS